MNAAMLIPLAIKASLLLLVFSLGLRASMADVLYLVRRPSELARAILSMNLLMPVVAAALALSLDLHPAVKIALVMLAVAPLPPAFPNKALKQGGGVSYTVGLLVAATLVAIVLIPVTMEILERVFGIPLQVRARMVLGLVGGSLLLPLALGVAIHRLAPGLAERAANPIAQVGNVLLLVAVVPIIVKLWPVMLSLIGNGTVLVMVVFVLVGLTAGHLLGGPDPDNRTVLALATATRHPGIAIAIANANFPTVKLAPAAIILYLLVSVVASIPYLKWRRGQQAAGVAPTPA